MNKVKGTPLAAKTSKQEGAMAESLELNWDDQLAVDPKLKSEIAAAGLAYRWINAAKFKSNYGYDARQWQPYKRTANTPLENNSFGYADAEGFIRRGDLLLAVRPQAIQKMAKDRNRSKIDNLAGSQRKAAADQIKQSFKNAGLDGNAKVIEGYEEND